MIHLRILSTYPPALGLPEESFDLTLPLRKGFASTPAEAHKRILEGLAAGDVFTQVTRCAGRVGIAQCVWGRPAA